MNEMCVFFFYYDSTLWVKNNTILESVRDVREFVDILFNIYGVFFKDLGIKVLWSELVFLNLDSLLKFAWRWEYEFFDF